MVNFLSWHWCFHYLLAQAQMDSRIVMKLAIGLMENPGSGQFGNVWSHLNHTVIKNVNKEDKCRL